MLLPLSREVSGFFEVVEVVHLQELVPEAAVEGLHVSVLPRGAGSDVQGLYADISHPLLYALSNEFTAVVRAYVLGCATFAHEAAEVIQDILALNGATGFQRQALAGVFIDNHQKLQRPAVRGSVVDEIPGPHVVGRYSFALVTRVGINADSLLFTGLSRNPVPFSLPKSMYPLVVDSPPTAL
jgi:hypothetical protein